MIPVATATTESGGASEPLSGGNCIKVAHAVLWSQAEDTAIRVSSMFTRAVSVGCLCPAMKKNMKCIDEMHTSNSAIDSLTSSCADIPRDGSFTHNVYPNYFYT